MDRSHRHAAFTLVELLVVIGIIALLISILLAVLTKARDQANAVKCAAHMRQIMQAWFMYASDFKGWVPIPPIVGETYPGRPGDAGSLACYMSDAAPPPNYAGVIRYDRGAFWPYLLPGYKPGTGDAVPGVPGERSGPSVLKKIMNCPADAMDTFRPVFYAGLDLQASLRRNFSYSWNADLRVPENLTGDLARKINQIRHPDHKIVLIEESGPNDQFFWFDLRPPGPSMPVPNNNDPGFLHFGGANHGFADGHVQRLAPTDVGYSLAKSLTQRGIIRDPNKMRSYFLLSTDH